MLPNTPLFKWGFKISAGIDSWGYYVCGLPVGSPDVLKLWPFMGKNQLTGLTCEYKNQFYKCKMVSSSCEKHPRVLVNHSLKQGPTEWGCTVHGPVHSGLPQKRCPSKTSRQPPQHAQDTGSGAQWWRDPQFPLFDRQKEARMLKPKRKPECSNPTKETVWCLACSRKDLKSQGDYVQAFEDLLNRSSYYRHVACLVVHHCCIPCKHLACEMIK